MTSFHDPDNAEHRDLKKGIEQGAGLPDIVSPETVLDGLQAAGFEVIEARDLAEESDPETPWHSALDDLDVTRRNSPGTTSGRRVAAWMAKARQGRAFAPKGTTKVLQLLDLFGKSTKGAGRLGIFTPMFYFKARKPE